MTPTKFRRSKFPGNMHNYIWCPYYLPSFMKFCQQFQRSCADKLCDGQTDGQDKNNMSPHKSGRRHNNNKRSKNNEHPNCAWESQLTLPHVRNLICRLQQVVNLLRLPINAVLACKYIEQSKQKCFKFSRAAPHLQDGSDTITPRNRS